MEEVKTKIKDYLSRSVSNWDLQDDEDFFDLGLFHSLFAIQLVLFIEKEFGVELETDDLELSNISTLNKVTSLVLHKM